MSDFWSSVTEDAHANQYTGAQMGQIAKAASLHAYRNSTWRNHKDAARAHRDAQMAYKAENNVPKMLEHARQADSHDDYARSAKYE